MTTKSGIESRMQKRWDNTDPFRLKKKDSIPLYDEFCQADELRGFLNKNGTLGFPMKGLESVVGKIMDSMGDYDFKSYRPRTKKEKRQIEIEYPPQMMEVLGR